MLAVLRGDVFRQRILVSLARRLKMCMKQLVGNVGIA